MSALLRPFFLLVCKLRGHDWGVCFDGTNTFAVCDRCGAEERS